MKRRHMEKEIPHSSARYPRSGHTEHRARCQQAHTQRKKLTADLLRPRAQGHPNADLPSALRHGVAQYSVSPDGSEQQSDRGKEGRE